MLEVSDYERPGTSCGTYPSGWLWDMQVDVPPNADSTPTPYPMGLTLVNLPSPMSNLKPHFNFPPSSKGCNENLNRLFNFKFNLNPDLNLKFSQGGGAASEWLPVAVCKPEPLSGVLRKTRTHWQFKLFNLTFFKIGLPVSTSGPLAG